MLKPCYRCKELVPSNQYEAHVQAHKNQEQPRKLGNSNEWQRIRAKVLALHGKRCAGCGITQATLRAQGRYMDVHHIDGNSENNSLTNLEPRCPDCHEKGGTLTYLR
jgi:predicted HNH restriction endonuclease